MLALEETIRKASLFESLRLGTAGLRPQARAQAGVAPLLRNGGDSPVSQGDVPLSAILPLYRAAFTVLASRTVYLISDVLLTIYGACN